MTRKDIVLDEAQTAANPETEFVETGAEVAGFMQLVMQTGLAEAFAIFSQILTGRDVILFERLHDRFGGQHAGAQGCVTALDFGSVQCTGVTANDQATREAHFGQRIQTTLIEGTRAVADTLAAFQILLDNRVKLVFLKFVVGADVRILISEINDKPHINLIVFCVIQEATTGPGIAVTDHRIAGSVHDQPFLVFLRRNFPDFFKTDTVMLRIAVLVQLKFGNQLFAQVTPATFCENCIFGVEFKTWLKGVFLFAIRINAHVTRGDTFYRTIFIVENFGSGKSGKHLGAQLHGLFSQPSAQIAE